MLRLLDPRRPSEGRASTEPIADPFRQSRAELFARALERHAATPRDLDQRLLAAAPPDRPQTEIFTCTDARYLLGASVTLYTLLKHNTGSLRDWRLTVFCEDEVLELASAVFQELSTAFGTPIDLRASSELVSNAAQLRVGWGVFTPGLVLSEAAYYRLYAVRQLIADGASGRALYIDVDTCVYAGLEELIGFDMADQPLAARLDDATGPTIWLAAIRLGVDANRYLNSGVLLFDLSNPELRPLIERSIEIVATEQHRLTMLDQCALNLAFCGKFALLPERFNGFIKPETPVEALPKDPTIAHFSAAPKPWDPLYASAKCMPWLREFAAMAEVVSPDLVRAPVGIAVPGGSSPDPVAFAASISLKGSNCCLARQRTPSDVRGRARSRRTRIFHPRYPQMR